MLFRDDTRAGVSQPQRLGDFRIERELGRGGMGVVYLATQESIGRKVAVKVLPLGASPMLDSVERFHREAAIVARLQHEGIVPIYAMGQEQGCLYYAMEYVEGETLRERVARGPIAPREAAEIARDVARALHHAHGAGVVHRDVKPGNILIDARGKAKLADFGLARVTGSQTLTIPGDILGTPAYMSPEQAGGARALDARSDVYSVGVVLYEALAGKAPVDPQAPVLVQLAAVKAEEPPSVTRLNPRIPRDLAVIVAHAMAKERDRRYADAAALAEDLDRWLRGEAILARPPSLGFRATRFVRRHRAAAVAGGIIALLLIAVAVYLLTRPGRLTLELQPPDVRVWIDGAPVEAVNRVRLAAGAHRLRVEREGYAAVDLTYTISRGESATLPVNLRRLQQRVTILTDPPDCRLTFVGRGGGRVRHLSPIESELIDTDLYELVVEHDGRYRRRIEVAVTPERPVEERIYLPSAVLWRAKEDQRCKFVTGRAGPEGEVVVAAMIDSGRIVFFRGRDGTERGRGATDEEFPSGALVDPDGDGESDLWVSCYSRLTKLLRWPTGEEIWSQVAPAGWRWMLLEPPVPGEPLEYWHARRGGLEAVDIRTGEVTRRVDVDLEGTVRVAAFGRDAAGVLRYAVLRADSVVAYRFPVEETGRLPMAPFDDHCAVERADLDGDGLLDLVISHCDGAIRAYRAEPLALLWAAEPMGLPHCRFAVGVLRPGERPSVVVIDSDHVRIWDAEGRGMGSHALPGVVPTWPCLADMDADGDRDLVCATSDAVWVLDLFSGQTLWEVPGVSEAGWSAVADLDDDGLLDMVFSTMGGGIVAIPGPKVVWEHRAGHGIRRPPAVGDVSGDGVPDVVLTSLDYFAYALEGGTGRVLWKVSMENQAATTPAFVGSGVIAAAWGGRVRRIRGETGEVLWTYQPQGEAGWGANFHASPAAADLDGDGRWEVLLAEWQTSRDEGRERGAVHCVDAETGRARWVRLLGAPFAAAPVVLPGGRILAGDTQGQLTCLAARDGSILWQTDVGGDFRAEASCAPAEMEGRPFVVWPVGGRILRVDGEGATELEAGRGRFGIAWARQGESWIAVTTGPTDVRGVEWTSGRDLWRWESPEPLGPPPVTADLDGDGAVEVIVAGRSGEVTVLRAATGERVWRFGVGAEVQAAPCVVDLDADGAPEIVLAAMDGRVVAIRGRGRRWSGEWAASLGDLRGSCAPDSVGPPHGRR